jgi:acyl-CoA thioesterase
MFHRMTGRTIIGKTEIERYHTPMADIENAASGDARAKLARRVADTLVSREGTGAAWNLEIEDAGEGYARVAMRLMPEMLNGFGIAHGGMVFALADSAFAYACNSRNIATVAQGATISFLDSGRAGERLVAEARERAIKGRTGVYAVTVRGEDDRVIAEMQGLSRSIGGPVIEEV